jgi:hypothetical protein
MQVDVLIKKKQYEETEKMANGLVHATHDHHRARQVCSCAQNTHKHTPHESKVCAAPHNELLSY